VTGDLLVNGTVSRAKPTALVAGSGITAGVGTIHEVMVSRTGNLVETKILIDLTGLNCGGTAADIIGVNSAANCHIGRITTAINGVVFGGYMRCLEAPVGGNADIDLYSATESTGTEDAPVTDLTETQLLNGGAQTIGLTGVLTAFPAANEYLYLACGTATAATYTAGKLEIVLYGIGT
jgi:hypothetical protein